MDRFKTMAGLKHCGGEVTCSKCPYYSKKVEDVGKECCIYDDAVEIIKTDADVIRQLARLYLDARFETIDRTSYDPARDKMRLEGTVNAIIAKAGVTLK